MTTKNPAAVALGSIKTAKKAASSRENGKKGGRPKEWNRLENVHFFSAAEAAKTYSTCRKAIISQPGYRKGERMTILRTKTGGYRLYCLVGGQWHDASLNDL